MNIRIRNMIEIEKPQVGSFAMFRITQKLTLDNPKYLENQRMDYSNYNTPKELRFYKSGKDILSIPRGCMKIATDILDEEGLTYKIYDETETRPRCFLTFRGELREYQQEAVEAVLSSPIGFLSAGTAAGKTVMAMNVMARRDQPTLILVHTKELLHQWGERLRDFLGIEAGLLGDGYKKIKPVTVGIVQSVKSNLPDLQGWFGQVIVDEAHRAPTMTFTDCIQAFPCKYLLGLSATPYRSDGLTQIIHWTMGDLVHQVDNEALKEKGSILKPEIIIRETGFESPDFPNWNKLVTGLINDPDRNKLIAGDVSTEKSGVNLICSERKAHLKTLANMVDGESAILTGETTKAQRRKIIHLIREGMLQNIFSTPNVLGEGFDCPELTNLFLTTPMSFEGKIKQIAGRILRPKEGKQPKIYDYADVKFPALNRQAETRQQIYQDLI